MKTPEEIKKGLECCYSPVEPMLRCEACPYYGSIVCKMRLHTDALAYIQQLEAENSRKDDTIMNLTELLNIAHDETAKYQKLDTIHKQTADLLQIGYSKVSKSLCDKEIATVGEILSAFSQVKRERDALLEDIKKAAIKLCHVCKHSHWISKYGGETFCGKTGRGVDGVLACGMFEWRGVPEGD